MPGMSKPLVCFLLALSGEAARVAHRSHGGDWVARGATEKAAGGLEFHGVFRDLSLWKNKRSEAEEDPAKHVWVVEYASNDILERERARAESTDLKVLFHKGDSLVLEGDVPASLGYDGCGGDAEKTVIPVADHEVIHKPMAKADYDKYMALAQEKDPRILQVLSNISRQNLQEQVEHLVSYGTRHSHSLSQGLDPAAAWALNRLRDDYGWEVTRHSFQSGGYVQKRITPQIVATLNGFDNPNRVVVLGAHLDSIARRVHTAPGADDNASGSSAILEIARLIFNSGMKFRHTLMLILFTGNKQRLKGSSSWAYRMKVNKQEVIGMINLDMTGWVIPDTPISINVQTRDTDPDLSAILLQTAETYYGDKAVIGKTTQCCSDEQSFMNRGFPATGLFESPGSQVYYPEYQKEGDLPPLLNWEQTEYITGAALAAAIPMLEPLPAGWPR